MMLVALLLQCCGVGFAQNNPFGMNDSFIRSICVRANCVFPTSAFL